MPVQEVTHGNENERAAECIDNCYEAAQTAEWCATECIAMGDEEMADCINLCRDVADLTTLHARMMVRNSPFSGDVAETCADLCEACAEECDQFDAEHCEVCADVLRDCADSCRDMAST